MKHGTYSNILMYTKKYNNYYLDTIYPSGKRTGKCTITKKKFELAKELAKHIELTNKSLAEIALQSHCYFDVHLFISNNKIIFTDI